MKTLSLLLPTILLSLSLTAQENNFWIELNRPVSTQVSSIEISADNVLYAGMHNDHGIFKSIDFGATWEQFALNNNISIYSLMLLPNGDMFAGVGSFDIIYRYTAETGHWEGLLTYEYGGNPVDFLMLPNGWIFTVTSEGGPKSALRSKDYGNTWENIMQSRGMNTSIVNKNDSTLFISVTDFMGFGTAGVYRSYDYGDTWEHCWNTNKHIWSLGITSNGVLFAGSVGNGSGIYRSIDDGNTWQTVKTGAFVESFVVTPDNVIYAGVTNEHATPAGVLVSYDLGDTWEWVNSGLTDVCVYGLALAPDGHLYAYGNHIHRSVAPVNTGISNPAKEKTPFTLYPVPANEFCIVKPGAELVGMATLRLLDITGKRIMEKTILLQNNFRIDTSGLQPGIYMVTLSDGKQTYTQKMIKTIQ